MGTRLFVLGIYSLGLVFALLVVTLLLQGGSQDNLLIQGYVMSGLYWVYSSLRILSGKNVLARKTEEWLNSRKR